MPLPLLGLLCQKRTVYVALPLLVANVLLVELHFFLRTPACASGSGYDRALDAYDDPRAELRYGRSNGVKRAKEVAFEQLVHDYIAEHRKVMRVALQPTFAFTPPYRFLKCDHLSGWGNQFQQILSCLFFGLITGRTAFMSDAGSYIDGWWDQYFGRPAFQFVHVNLTDLSERRLTSDFLYELEQNATPSFFHWKAHYHGVACDNFTESFGNISMLAIKPPDFFDYWASALMFNPHYRLLHRTPRNWIQLLFPHVFRLREVWQKVVDDFKRKHFGKYTIGIQARTWAGAVNAGGQKYLPHIPIEVFTQAAEMAALEADVDFDDVRFFVVTPDEAYRQKARDVWGAHRVITFDLGEIDERSINGTLNGLLNMWLLGECDDAIVTEMSSYGVMGMARTGKVPITCTHERFCYRRLTPEPCTEVPFPVMKAPCHEQRPSTVYMPGVQSTCSFWSQISYTKKYTDAYGSWAWTGEKATWDQGYWGKIF